ncbi:MAG: TRAP transporter small permease subunit [Rhodocyclaceae bacterium]|nr:TRAP transporter small permease subunit [Rhodocyclaceae bacterium]
MNRLLQFSRLIDRINAGIGRFSIWLVLVVTLVSAANATSRYAFNLSSNALLEIQWYLFSAVFLFCSGYTLLRNEHVRIDLLSSRLTDRGRNWVDVVGLSLFLIPVAAMIVWMSWPHFVESWVHNEQSSNAGGLVRWPVRLLLPAGFALLGLQAISELIKRIAFLMGKGANPLASAADEEAGQ